jgi:putative hemolysin
LLSAFFSGIEIAFISANRLKIALDSEDGGVKAKILSYFSSKPSWFIGTMLLGNNVMVVIYSIYMSEALDPTLASWLGSSAEISILLISTLVATIFLLVFAEFLPKAIFRINANSILSGLSIPLFIVYVVLFIPTFITIGFAELILKIFVKKDANLDEDLLAFEKIDLDTYLEEGLNAATSSEEEQDYEVKIFHNAMNFGEVIARDCMVPRNEIIAFEINDEILDLRDKFIETELSKILIYKETIDNIIGYVHSFEMFKKPETIKAALLPVSVIPESMTANQILEDLIKKNRSIAVVLDEYGGTAGMLTMEDIIEEIFGEIEDEHDFDEIINEKISDTEFKFSGRAEIDFINEKYIINLPQSEEYETLAGFIISELEDIPELNDELIFENYRFTILEVSQTKIELVQIEIMEDDL